MTKPKPNKFAKEQGIAIKAAREFKGKTVEGIAEHLGVVRQTIWRYESGNANVSSERLQEIADYLGVSINRLSPTSNRNKNK